MNLDEVSDSDLLIGYALEMCGVVITPTDAWTRLARWADQMDRRWVHGATMTTYAEAVMAAQGAAHELLDTMNQIDITLSVGGPTLDLLLERDIIKGAVGHLNLIVIERCEHLLDSHIDELPADAADSVEQSLRIAGEYPNLWYIEEMKDRAYYLEPLVSLAEKLNAPISKGTT